MLQSLKMMHEEIVIVTSNIFLFILKLPSSYWIIFTLFFVEPIYMYICACVYIHIYGGGMPFHASSDATSSFLQGS